MLLLSLCSAGVATTASAKTILVLGDSISAAYGIAVESGWVSLLQKRFDEHDPGRYKVINASISGDTTALGLRRLPPLLAEHSPDQVIVELGGNDGLRGMPLANLRQNLQAIIDLCRDGGAEVVLLSIDLPPSYGAVFNNRYRTIFDELEKANGLLRISLSFALLNDRDLVQADGIHPTAEAQPLLLDAVWPAVRPES